MSLKIGIVGLPNAGKSTLFNALTRSRAAQVANYPFTTIDPNLGVVEVPDERIQRLVEIVKPAKVIPATVEFVDIAGLVKGAHKGEGLGNKFLGHIRGVHAICHVIRGFGDNPDPEHDREIIHTELELADLEIQEKWKKEKKKIDQYPPLLSEKPTIEVLNVSERELGMTVPRMSSSAGADQEIRATSAILISAKLEEDLQDLSPEDAQKFLQELGVESSGLDKLIRAAYDLLGYITFFTAGPKEVHAWNIVQGTKAPQAAGVIHSDFERGFIRAEVISYDDFVQCGGEQGAKAAGKLRTEGKEYVIADGDIIHIRFNV